MSPYRDAAAPVPPKTCRRRWRDMRGEGSARFCHACEQHVYQLATLSSDEARALVTLHEGEPDIPLLTRSDGTLVAGPCDDAHARYGRRRTLRIGALAAVAGALAAVLLYGAHIGLSRLIPPRPRPRPGVEATRPTWIDPVELGGTPTLPPAGCAFSCFVPEGEPLSVDNCPELAGCFDRFLPCRDATLIERTVGRCAPFSNR